MKRKALTILGWLISIALLTSLAMKLDFHSIGEKLADAKWHYLALAGLLNIAVIALKAVRWQWLMWPQKRTRFGSIFRATMIGLAANNVMPARGGDVLKIYLLGKWEGVCRAMLTSITALDKFFDGLAILILFGLLSMHSTFPVWVQRGTTIFAIVMVIILILAVGLLLHHRRTTADPAASLGRLSHLAHRLGSGMGMLTSKRLVLGTLALSIANCLLQVGTILCCQLALGVHVAIWVPILVFVAINLAIMVPSAPSNIGPFEVAAVLAYTWLGVGKDMAFSIALIYHAVQIIPVTLIGLLFYLSSTQRSLSANEPIAETSK